MSLPNSPWISPPVQIPPSHPLLTFSLYFLPFSYLLTILRSFHFFMQNNPLFLCRFIFLSFIICMGSASVTRSTEFNTDLLLRASNMGIGQELAVTIPVFYPNHADSQQVPDNLDLTLKIMEERHLPFSNQTQLIFVGQTQGERIKARFVVTPEADLFSGFLQVIESPSSSITNYFEPKWWSLKSTSGPPSTLKRKIPLPMIMYTWERDTDANVEDGHNEIPDTNSLLLSNGTLRTFEKRSSSSSLESMRTFGKRAPLLTFPESQVSTGSVRLYGKSLLPTCRVAVIAGKGIVDTYGGSLKSFIEGLVMDASEHYQNLLGVRLETAEIVAIRDSRHRLARNSVNTLNDLDMALRNGEIQTSRGKPLNAGDYCVVHYLRGSRPSVDDYSRVNGRSLVGGFCQGSRNQNIGYSSVANRPRREVVRTIMHEIGHQLGSNHDPQQCFSESSAFLMSTVGNPESPNFMRFSGCSLNKIIQKVAKGAGSCLSKLTPPSSNSNSDDGTTEDASGEYPPSSNGRVTRIQYGNSNESPSTQGKCSQGRPIGVRRTITKMPNGSQVLRTTTFCQL